MRGQWRAPCLSPLPGSGHEVRAWLADGEFSRMSTLAEIEAPARFVTSCSVHGATCFQKAGTMAHMETAKPTRNENARRNRCREVTIEILRTKHEVFTAAAGEIARRAKVPVTAEAVMAFLLEAECDAKDLANMYCWRVLSWPVEWIEKVSR